MSWRTCLALWLIRVVFRDFSKAILLAKGMKQPKGSRLAGFNRRAREEKTVRLTSVR